MFNDQMESKAIENSGLGNIPTTAYKSHFGHTFGASGIVEPIITMCSLDEGLILPVRGFEEIGVSGRIKICNSIERTEKRAFIKTQSGFGGCNGAIAYSRYNVPVKPLQPVVYKAVKSLMIKPGEVILDGEALQFDSSGAAMVSEIFKKHLSDCSRFFKMDLFSRLAYVATGLVAKDSLKGCAPEDIALFIFTLNGSVLADRKHLSTFSDPEDFYPSPAVFINTLPNVVLGEIAVRNSIKGETSLVMLPERDDTVIDKVIMVSASASRPSAVICGWVDCDAEDSYIADVKLLKINE
jgi:3-oxoacyl-[acyl-carrier-protein] synthase-1